MVVVVVMIDDDDAATDDDDANHESHIGSTERFPNITSSCTHVLESQHPVGRRRRVQLPAVQSCEENRE